VSALALDRRTTSASDNRFNQSEFVAKNQRGTHTQIGGK
jgi:hypothetical protein